MKTLTPPTAGAEDPAATLKERLKRLLRRRPGSKDIKDIDVRLGDDSLGRPAIFIAFIVDDDVDPSPQKVARLGVLAYSVTTSALQWDSTRWPYVEFRGSS